MSTPYVVKTGDTIWTIARQHGVGWKALYNHPDNEALREKRPNPDQLFPGDVVMIPQGVSAPSDAARKEAIILIGVDGTGEHAEDKYDVATDAKYDAAMKDSFVSRICRATRSLRKKYYRGPDWKGFGGNLVRPATVSEEVQRLLEQSGQSDPIFLTGYSRGGAIVIHAARLLHKSGIEVEGMFLFDAVERSIMLKAKSIPDNVKHCYHAVRKKETHSRRSFGNCGLVRDGGMAFDGKQEFFTTHGGMGGTPWGAKGARKDGFIHESFPDGKTNVTPAAEAEGTKMVHEWMWPFLRDHDVL